MRGFTVRGADGGGGGWALPESPELHASARSAVHEPSPTDSRAEQPPRVVSPAPADRAVNGLRRSCENPRSVRTRSSPSPASRDAISAIACLWSDTWLSIMSTQRCCRSARANSSERASTSRAVVVSTSSLMARATVPFVRRAVSSSSTCPAPPHNRATIRACSESSASHCVPLTPGAAPSAKPATGRCAR